MCTHVYLCMLSMCACVCTRAGPHLGRARSQDSGCPPPMFRSCLCCVTHPPFRRRSSPWGSPCDSAPAGGGGVGGDRGGARNRAKRAGGCGSKGPAPPSAPAAQWPPARCQCGHTRVRCQGTKACWPTCRDSLQPQRGLESHERIRVMGSGGSQRALTRSEGGWGRGAEGR